MTGLADRWRPQQFSQVVGQEHVTRILRNATTQSRLAKAYLLEGTRGTGKTTTARILARSVMCHDAQQGEPCLSCDHCSTPEGAPGAHVEIDAASNRNADDVRSLKTAIEEDAIIAGPRAYIVDEAHMMTPTARGLLQQIIEDRSGGATIILCTTEAHQIPEGLRSRCQQHSFHRLNNRAVADHLAHICDQEAIAHQPDALMLIAHAADGGMRDALQTLEHVITSSQGQVTTDAVNQVLGSHIRQTILSLARHLLAGNETEAANALKAAHAEGAEPRIIHRETAARLADGLAISWGHQRGEQLPQTVVAALRGANWERTAQVLWEWSHRRPPADEHGTAALENAVNHICAPGRGA